MLRLDEGADSRDCPAFEAAVALWAHSKHLRSEAGQPYVQINLSGNSRGDLRMDLTPAQARDLAAALLDLAGEADPTSHLCACLHRVHFTSLRDHDSAWKGSAESLHDKDRQVEINWNE